jgi:hypothetical protein
MARRTHSPAPEPREGEVLASHAAERLGLTAQSIGQWTAKPDAPVRREGTRVFVRWPAFARWREQELCKQAATEATAGMRKQLDAAQGGDPMGRKLKADARKAEIEVEFLERSALRVEDALQHTEKLLTDLRAGLVPFPRTAAPKLIGAKTVIELEQRLHKEVVRLMEGLSSPTFGMDTPADTEQAA